MTRESIAQHVVALASMPGRSRAAECLAREVGAEALLLLVRDSAVEAMLPAAGFPHTLRGGESWRAFVRRCGDDGILREEVELPAGTRRAAAAICSHGIAAVFLGGRVEHDALAAVGAFIPLLAALLHAEQEAVNARAEASDARSLASRSEALARALESARAEHARLNAQLREQNRRKDDFLAMLGHELRNPLAPLVMAIEMLRRRPPRDSLEKRQGEIMLRQVKQLSRLVDDLLDISRVSHGRIVLHRRNVRLAEVVDDAIEATRPTLRAMGHELEVVLAAKEVVVNGDPVRLTQAISNILHNAGKYTPSGGRIAIELQREGDEALVRVVDNGIGIDAAILPRIFDLFVQAPGSLDRSQGGLGIGLTLVKSLVELHGGRVAAESDGPGRGSIFTVKLPLVREARESPTTADAPRKADPAPAISILVVDDNRDAADTVADIARSHGHRVGVAYGGLEALQVGADLQPQLVLLDIGMPEMDGYELARRLRRTVSAGAMFAALLGYGSERDRARSREAGFDEHLVKPLTAGQLLDVVQRAASARELARG